MGHLSKADRSKRNAAIIKEYLAGDTPRAIAQRRGMGTSTVDTIIREAGVTRHTEHVTDYPGLVERFMSLRGAGVTIIAATARVNSEFGTSFAHTTLREHLRKADEDPAPKAASATAPEPKTEIHFDGLIIRKMQVRVPAHDSRNGYAMISLPAVGMAGMAA